MTKRSRTLWTHRDYAFIWPAFALTGKRWTAINTMAEAAGDAFASAIYKVPMRSTGPTPAQRKRIAKLLVSRSLREAAQALPWPKRSTDGYPSHDAEFEAWAERYSAPLEEILDLQRRLLSAKGLGPEAKPANGARASTQLALSDDSDFGTVTKFAAQYIGPDGKVEAVQKEFGLSLEHAAAYVRGENPHANDQDVRAMLVEALRENERLRSLNRALRTQVMHWMPTDDLL